MDEILVEKPYSDSRCVQGSLVNNVWWNGWNWSFECSLRIGGHSKNWSMGSLDIDIFSIRISLGPVEWLFAWRLTVFPPNPTVTLSDAMTMVYEAQSVSK